MHKLTIDCITHERLNHIFVFWFDIKVLHKFLRVKCEIISNIINKKLLLIKLFKKNINWLLICHVSFNFIAVRHFQYNNWNWNCFLHYDGLISKLMSKLFHVLVNDCKTNINTNWKCKMISKWIETFIEAILACYECLWL